MKEKYRGRQGLHERLERASFLLLALAMVTLVATVIIQIRART